MREAQFLFSPNDSLAISASAREIRACAQRQAADPGTVHVVFNAVAKARREWEWEKEERFYCGVGVSDVLLHLVRNDRLT